MAAIEFPIALYPIVQGAGKSKHLTGVVRDTMDDGTPHTRAMHSTQYQDMPLEFEPMSEARCTALMDYLFDNASQEFLLFYAGVTWVGFFWKDPELERSDAQWWVSCSFYGGRL